MVKADKCIYTLWQSIHITNDDYLKLFDSQVTVLETFGGGVPKHPLLVKHKSVVAGVRDPNYSLGSYQKRLEKSVVEDYPACPMMSGAHSGLYLSLKNKLENSMLLGSDNYPKSREELLQVLNHYKDK